MIAKTQVHARIERLAIEGLNVRRIARTTGATVQEISDILQSSPAFRERSSHLAERRSRRFDAKRRLVCRDIGRAARVPFLTEHRDARGFIDWEAVHGYSSWREEARRFARDEAALLRKIEGCRSHLSVLLETTAINVARAEALMEQAA